MCAAPVTRASGKTTGVYFRWAANRRARKALTAFAHNARMQSPWAGRLYADARARGKRNPHATRIVARAWLRVIWACWHTGTPYDPTPTSPSSASQPPDLTQGTEASALGCRLPLPGRRCAIPGGHPMRP